MGTFQFEIYFYGTVNTNFQSDEHREPTIIKKMEIDPFFWCLGNFWNIYCLSFSSSLAL